MTIDEQIGKRLEEYRIAKGITQVAVSKAAKVQHGFLNQILNGKKGISAKVLINITSAFKDLNLRWLLTGEGEMYELEKIYVEPPAGLPSGVEEPLKIEYLKPEGELERIKRLLDEHERRLRDLEKEE